MSMVASATEVLYLKSSGSCGRGVCLVSYSALEQELGGLTLSSLVRGEPRSGEESPP